MRSIGLLGGISWGATADYYRRINLEVKRRLGGQHSAEMLIRSFDLQPLLEHAEDVAEIELLFEQAAGDLCVGGASVLGVASLTGHRYSGKLRRLPALFVDIVGTAGTQVRQTGRRCIALWATSFALNDLALLQRLADACGTEFVLPPQALRPRLDQIVFTELADQNLSPSSLALLSDLLARQIDAGAQALLLGSTDFSMVAPLLGASVPVLDIAQMHCQALVDAALEAPMHHVTAASCAQGQH